MNRGILLLSALLALALVPDTLWAVEVERVNVAEGGDQATRASGAPSVSSDGRFVAFASDADNLTPDDTGAWWGVDPDIFVRDRETGGLELVSGSVVASGMFGRSECRAPSISADGRFVAFECFSGSFFAHRLNFNIYLHDRLEGTTSLVSRSPSGGPGNGSSTGASISADGRRVAFTSTASNLVAGDGNGRGDVFVADLPDGTIRRVSLPAQGGEGNGHSVRPSISANGRYVVFASSANNLLPGDGNGTWDVFRHDQTTGETVQVSAAAGPSDLADVSADGQKIAFRTRTAGGAWDLYLNDFQAGTSEQVLAGAGDGRLVLSGDGSRVAFSSQAAGLVAGDANAAPDVFLHDLSNGHTERVSVASDGTEGNGVSDQPAISADGRHVAFASKASNLVEGDGNGVADIFLASSTADTTPPEVSLTATPGTLWPPNKKYVDVLVEGLATDDSGQVSVEISVTDEYGEMVGMFVPGFGSTVALESWREGDDFDGRIYTLTAVATDASGNQTTVTAEVVVPHDMRDKKGR